MRKPYIRSWVFTKKQTNRQMDWKMFSSNLLTAYAWPLFLLIVILIFRKDVSVLIKRAKSIEIGGTKSEFVDYAAALGYVESQLSELAAEPSREDRERLANDIRQTSHELQGLHPLAFAFLAEIGRGVSSDSAWLEHGRYIIQLKERGYITLEPDASEANELKYKMGDPKNSTIAKLTKKGDEFLVKLGYTDRITRAMDKERLPN